MFPAEQIAKRFLILFVALVSIYPRMPFNERCTVAGRLSRNFRLLLLGIVAVNLSRLFLPGNESDSPELGLFSDFLGVVEVTALTFLCFLTPDILETKLSRYINLTPGTAFYGPLVASCLLSFFGVVLSRTVYPNWWGLKNSLKQSRDLL